MKIVRPFVELGQFTPNACELIEAAGRTCYKSEPKGDAGAFVRMLIRRGHESVIEHASATFRIVCDRGVSHEIVRHRLASYSQESTRYNNYAHAGELEFIQPPGLAAVAHHAWTLACAACEQSYLEMIGVGCSPQIARSVLPNCLKTELVMTANFREWRHFIRLRCAPAAHPQMREIAGMIRDMLIANWPTVFVDLLAAAKAEAAVEAHQG